MITAKSKRTKKLLWGLVPLAVLVIGMAVWFAIPPKTRAAEPSAQRLQDPTLIKHGEYVARLGDCVACHTDQKGKHMAGGLALETPMGTIWSTNITPDVKTGLGGWTFAEFDRAMRKGVAADGHNLYPAMPYPSYAKITDDDMLALWAYLKHGVEPVEQANKKADMNFPFNMRFGLAYWNALFLDDTRFVVDPSNTELWNRGAYLTQGLGHCGACHTPRGVAFQEVAMTEKGRQGHRFLGGSQVENWNAVEIRDLWTVEDTVDLLKTGKNRFTSASGAMTEVITHSTQYFTDNDLVAMATYLKSLPSDTQNPVLNADVTYDTPKDTFTTRGGLAYTQFCADCHRPNGTGVKGVFPSLQGNPSIAQKDPATLIHITLTGWKTASTHAYPRVYTMPSFAQLGDQEIAEILTFTRQNWGGVSEPITSKQVASARKHIDPKIPTTYFETPRLAKLLSEKNAAQLVRGMRLNSETSRLLPQNVGNGLNCTSCHLNGGTVADGSPYVGVSAFFPSYGARAGKMITIEDRINGCLRRSMNGKPLPKDSPDMKAMVAYFDWMKGETKPEDKVEGRGIGSVDMSLKPNVNNGKKIYASQCAACHGVNGEGIFDEKGRVVYPALWGDRSFNIGAGLARTYKAAAFVKRNMPIGMHEKFPLGQGGLTDQEAIDVAEYFTHMPRPDFPDKVKDWPKDPKPSDARY